MDNSVAQQAIAQLSPGFIQAVMGIMTAVLIFVAAKIRSYVNNMKISEDFKKDLFATNDQIITSLKKVTATAGSELRQKLADGKLTDQELKELQDKVYAAVKEQIPDVEKRLEVHMTNGGQYVADTILGEIESGNKVTAL